MIYSVWNPDDEAREDAEHINAPTPEAAAEAYIAGVWNAGWSDSVELMVSDGQDDYEVTVEVEFEPSFYSYATKVRK